jgi:hypothetical protein
MSLIVPPYPPARYTKDVHGFRNEAHDPASIVES